MNVNYDLIMRILFGLMGGGMLFIFYGIFGFMTLEYKFNSTLCKIQGFVFIGCLIIGAIIGALIL